MMWPTTVGRTPLWAYADVNPSTPEVADLVEGDRLTFLPLEAVWPDGNADYSREIEWTGNPASYNLFRRGDVLLPKVAPTFSARRAMVVTAGTALGLASSEVFVVRPRAGVDPRWLVRVLQVDEFIAEGTASLQGVGGLKRISSQQVRDFAAPTATPQAQEEIADFLDQETAEMDAMVGTIDDLTEVLYDFRLSATGRIFDTWFDDLVVPIWSLLEAVKDQNHPDEEVLSVYRDYGVIPKSSRSDNHNRTPEDLTTYQLVCPGDLVINKMKAWQGSLGVSEYRGIVSPDYQVARPCAPVLSAFLHGVLRSPRMIPQYRVRSTGIRPSQWRLYWDDFADLKIPLPPLAEQRRIVAELDKVTGRIDSMIEKATELKSLIAERRSALITDVVTGKMEVPAHV